MHETFILAWSVMSLSVCVYECLYSMSSFLLGEVHVPVEACPWSAGARLVAGVSSGTTMQPITATHSLYTHTHTFIVNINP